MKNASKNVLLWQNKRNELPLTDDPQADWGAMELLLDEHMPVAKKLGRFKGFRGLPAVFIAFSAAAMLYVAGNIYSLQKHSHEATDRFHKGNPTRMRSNVDNTADTSKSTIDHTARNQNDTANPAVNQRVVNDKNGADNTNQNAANSAGTNTLRTSGNTSAGLAGAGKQHDQQLHQQHGQWNGRQNHQTNFGHGRIASYDKNAPGGRRAVARNSTSDENKPPGANDHGGQISGNVSDFNKFTDSSDPINNTGDYKLQPFLQPPFTFDNYLSKTLPPALPSVSSRLRQAILQESKTAKGGKKDKSTGQPNSKSSALDWGLLMGVNTSGSFTPKSQNNNFYGSEPIDPWFGLFATYKLNNSWALSTEAHFFSPQSVTTVYSHVNQSKVDSGQSLTITAARKMYAIGIPVYAVYRAGNGLSFKAGPVINFPVKQINTGSVLLPYSIRTDTTYYKNISATLNATQYQQSINFGISAGASYQYRRFIFGATYLRSLSGYSISSGLGTYKSYTGTFQFSIGFQLDKVKP